MKTFILFTVVFFVSLSSISAANNLPASMVYDSAYYRITNESSKAVSIALIMGTGERGYCVSGWITLERNTDISVSTLKGDKLYMYAKNTPYLFDGTTYDLITQRNWRDNTKSVAAYIYDFADFKYFNSIEDSDYRKVSFKDITSPSGDQFVTIGNRDLENPRGLQILVEALSEAIAEQQASSTNPNLSYKLTDYKTEYDIDGTDSKYSNATLFIYCKNNLIKTIAIHREKTGASQYKYTTGGFFSSAFYSEGELIRSKLKDSENYCSTD